MTKGLFDDVPLSNPVRDKAWEKFIKRRDVKALMQGKEDFKFPLDGSYDLWCIAWNMAWDEGFAQGWEASEDVAQADRERLAHAIQQMPFGDTSASFSRFVREFK